MPRIVGRIVLFAAISVVLVLGCAAESYSQIVTTGALRAQATDESGAKMEGVKVTLTSPALIDKNMVRETSGLGSAQFTTLSPGTYALRFEKQGYSTIVRDGVSVDVATTYMVPVTMKAGSSEEVTTISGEAARLDASTAEAGTTMGAEHLENIPTARDVWAVMQQAPRMRMERFDVGGSTMGTQTSYKNFGYGDQNRPMLDGVNLTEGTNGSGFYFDYGSFEQVNISGMGNTAEMPTPGTGYSMVVKSGGNQFHGMVYGDYENPAFQSTNVTEEMRKPWPEGQGIGEGDKLISFKTYNANIGGYAIKNRVWWFVGAFYQSMDKTKLGYFMRPGDPTENTKARGPFVDGKLKGTAGTMLASPTFKITLLPTRSDRVVLLEADNFKTFPERGGDALNPVASTYWQASNAYARKIGWMHAFSAKGMLDVTAGLGGYRWPDWSNGAPRPSYFDQTTRLYSGTRWAGDYQNYDPVRWQFYPTFTLFVDNWLGGSHDFKIGYDREKYAARRMYAGHPDNVRYYLNNGAPYQVDLMNTPSDYNYWTWTNAAFVTDTFSKGKWAFNIGVRWDSYRSDLPEMDWGGNNWSGVNPAIFGPQKFAGQTGVVKWSNFAPRVGFTYLLTPNTVIKANYGRYWFFPGLLSSSANKNQLGGALYSWNDVNGNRLLDPQLGEIGSLVQAYGARVSEIDPNLKQPYGDEIFVSIDRNMQILGGVSVRALYLFKNIKDLWQTINGAVPVGDSAYTAVQVPFKDEKGANTSQMITLYNLNPQYKGMSTDLVTNIGGYDRNHNLEFVVTKRLAGGWSLMSSLDLTWEKQLWLARSTPGGTGAGYGAPSDPNVARFAQQNFLNGVFKLSSTFKAPFDVSISPVVRYQLGDQWGRRATYTGYPDATGKNVAFNQGTVYTWMEEQNSRRRPNVTLFDIRAEKSFRFRGNTRVGLMFDLFNILNANSMTTTTDMTGANFNKWTEILTPRIFRLGARFTF